MSALAIGSLALTPNNSGGISVGLSAGLSGGTGTGYSYAIYRGTDPNFTANSAASLLATVSIDAMASRHDTSSSMQH